MSKTFTVTNISPFDLMRVGKVAFYEILDHEYRKLFKKDIKILDADISFIKNGLKIKVKKLRKVLLWKI